MDLEYSELDAQVTKSLYDSFSGLEEKLINSVNQEVIKALKQTTDTIVLGKPPMVVINKLSKNYNILYGFGEQRRAYSHALEKQGYEYNAELTV